MNRLLVVATGGVLGSLARYGVSLLVGAWTVGAFPWATFVVNLVGCLAIGYIATSRVDGPAWVRPFAVAGVLGGFTTFSALAFETTVLLDAGDVMTAIAYVVASVVLGLLAVRAGIAIRGRSAS